MKSHSSNPIKETLAKAHSIFLKAGNSLSPEMLAIRAMFLSPGCVQAFGDDTLYLRFLKNLISERFNLSFPEESDLYQQYFKDCILLKNLEQSLPGFSVDNYLSDTISLLETLKTPYYQAYVKTLFAMKSIFTDESLLRQTMKDFYGIMLKSSAQELPLVVSIVEQGLFYRQITHGNEKVIQGLLLSNLAQFAKKGSSFSHTALKTYLTREEIFFRQLPSDRVWTDDSLPELLAELMIYMEEHFSGNLPLSGHHFLTNDASSEEYGPSSQAVNSEFLNQFAYNMNCRNYVSNPAIGREEEIQDLALILISPKKSPILIGQAGVGKTSVVEGLAYALKHGKVPALLKDKKIFKLTTTSLLSGTKYVGEMEERMKKLMDELTDHPDVILFIDEIHTIVGAGSTENSNNDISNMLKPYIDRGDIKLIGATTSEEYQRFIKYDQALSRRFYPIEVEEPDRALCMDILLGSIPMISHETQVENPFSEEETKVLLHTILDLSAPDNQPADLQTHWPELPLSLLEMTFSYAALDSRNELSVEDFIHAVSHSNRLKKSVKLQAAEYFCDLF